MQGFVGNIEELSLTNDKFRQVLYTAQNSQLVIMSIKPGEEIGEEVHQLDQFIRVEQGEGKAVLNGAEHDLKDGSAVLVPAGTTHNIVNVSESQSLKLYTLYAPPHHKDRVVHETKEQAESDSEEFDGVTSP